MRYAIITDVHANYGALEAVDEDVRRLRTRSGEKIAYWFLGDLVGYGPDPAECIRWLKTAARIEGRWIPGNHDEWLLRPTRVSEEAATSLVKHREILDEPRYRGYAKWFKEAVDQAIRSETRSPRQEQWPEAGLEAFFVHAAVQPTQRRMNYLYPWEKYKISDTFDLLEREYKSQPTTALFCGHTHYPMWFYEKQLQPLAYERPLPLREGTHIINPGSVGQPRDGDSRAAYLLFDPDKKEVEFRRVEYEAAAVADRLLDNGYMPSLADRLLAADGRADLQNFYAVYRRPQWDLDVVVKD